MRTFYAVVVALVVALTGAAPALSYGPNPGAGQSVEACGIAIDRQVGAGIQAGGGPKSVDTGPLNCDHFWQDPTNPTGVVIGNGWPPPPFAP